MFLDHHYVFQEQWYYTPGSGKLSREEEMRRIYTFVSSSLLLILRWGDDFISSCVDPPWFLTITSLKIEHNIPQHNSKYYVQSSWVGAGGWWYQKGEREKELLYLKMKSSQTVAQNNNMTITTEWLSHSWWGLPDKRTWRNWDTLTWHEYPEWWGQWRERR